MTAAALRLPRDRSRLTAASRTSGPALGERGSDSAAARRRLLAWYDQHRRALPWRDLDPPDPFATFVSEAMLQQTQVATVIPYYLRFMERFPTLRALANASIDDVLPFWAGLGYYRRCHNLHAAARTIVTELGGEFPRDVEGLLDLPGIGRYTAGAIASIAFGVATPAVDGNARRVFSRVMGLPTKGHSSAELAQIDSLAAGWVSPRRPADFNQAIMELGATVCVPRQPRCATCPIRNRCKSAGGTGSRHPEERGDKPRGSLVRSGVKSLDLVTVAIEHRGRLFYRRRPDDGLWAGLWEWPTRADENGADPMRTARGLLRAEGFTAAGGLARIGELVHVLTHRRVRFYAYHVSVARAVRRGDGRWLSRGEESLLPMSRAQVKLIEALRANETANVRG